MRELFFDGKRKVLNEISALRERVSSSYEWMDTRVKSLEHTLSIQNQLLQSIFYSMNSKKKKKNECEKEKHVEMELALLDDIFNDTVT